MKRLENIDSECSSFIMFRLMYFNNEGLEEIAMIKKAMKICFVMLLIGIIIVCGDDETRDFLKRKMNRVTD